MTHQRLLTLSGCALIASAALSLAGGMLHPIVEGDSHSVASLTSPASPGAQLLIYAGALALMVGLPGAYAWLAPRVGALGSAGFGLYFLGNALSAQSHLVVEAFVAPEVARRAPELVPPDGTIIDAPLFATLQVVGGLVLVGGLLLTGVALLRSGAVPRWVGVVAVVGALGLTVPLPEVPVLTGLQVELARGVTVAAIGVLAVRSARAGSLWVPASSRARAGGVRGLIPAPPLAPRGPPPPGWALAAPARTLRPWPRCRWGPSAR